ncbi:serine hydrolase domain-containing protein [Kangiella koreensis]|uniref:Beta-lactamase n=1 Tax=Kangiella koreensis (strain DSM 16069 / JCM 12317 / KCTC 12182 / SW-125) TaxID=523791 RepID=C7R687_KANKD|nr:serine hydrolase [Kangiella koreensis]ACV25518.1 beta-lactamase [Kangiella koreensis DSM 16069]
MRPILKIFGVALIAVIAVALVIGLNPFIDRDAVATNPISLDEAPIAEAEAEKIRSFIETEADGIDAFIALRGEKILMQNGEVGTPMNLASARKSVVSLLFGIAADRDLIDIQKTLAELGIDESGKSLTATEKKATVEQLLKARSGVYLQSGAETVEIKDGRPRRGQYAPGEYYFYNNWDFNVLGAIFEQETGLSIGEALEQWLAVPLGMQDFNTEHVFYDKQGSDSDYRTYRIHMSARDLARLGALVAQDGIWNGKQVVSKEWIEKSTYPYSATNNYFYDGFGYSWWLNSEINAVAADGWGGQYMLINREQGLTVVTRRDTGNSMLGFLIFIGFKKQGHPADIQKIYKQMLEIIENKI